MMDFQAMFEDTTRCTGCDIFGAMKCYQSHSPEKNFLRGSSYWQIIHAEIVVSLFYFSMVSQYTNNLIYIYACLYVFCLSACVS